MKINVDANFIRSPKLSGIERFIVELVKHTASCSNGTLLNIFTNKHGQNFFTDLENVNIVNSPYNNKLINDQLWLPWNLSKYNADISLVTSLGPPRLIKVPFVLVLHDAVPWKFPKTLSKGAKYYYKPLLERALKSKYLKGVITVSNSSKEDIAQIYDGPIYTIYNGISEKFNSNKNIEIKKKFNIKGKYILSVGTLEPRKNLRKLLEAFEMLQRNPEYKDISLVLSGRFGWGAELDIPLGIKDKIIITGYISDQELIELYSNAELYVFPSIYEGFGFPLLEAMACGTPVISSDISCLPEIGGNAPLYFDPYNSRKLLDLITKVLGSNTLREQMIEKGKERIKHFTWESSAQQYLELLKKISESA